MQKEEFAKYIRVRAKELGLSITKLAQQTGISRQSLYDLFSGTTEQAKLSTIVSLAHTLQVHPIHLFRHLIDQVERPVYGAKNEDNMTLVSNITIPDNTEIKVGTVFTKTWDVKNSGSTAWIGRKLICMDQPSVPDFTPLRSKTLTTCRGLIPTSREISIKDTKAGKTVLVSIEFTAPDYPCYISTHWNITDEEGKISSMMREGLACYIRVVE